MDLIGSIRRFFRNTRRLRRHRNDHLLHSSEAKSRANRVNLSYWKSGGYRKQGVENFGDMLSPVVVEWMLERRGIDPDKPVRGTRHLYSLGSILFWKGSWQDMTVWGSGCLHHPYPTRGMLWKYRIMHRLRHRIDARAVRGPLTRGVFRQLWLKCPEVYGDPAILLPLFYRPAVSDVREYNVIPHHSNRDSIMKHPNAVDVLTPDWKKTVDAICSAKLNVTSSLHGIIVSEAYGIPAVLLAPGSGEAKPSLNLFKFDDYYRSTGRDSYPVAKSIGEALETPPPPLPNLKALQDGLIRAFPYDLWDA